MAQQTPTNRSDTQNPPQQHAIDEARKAYTTARDELVTRMRAEAEAAAAAAHSVGKREGAAAAAAEAAAKLRQGSPSHKADPNNTPS